MTNLIATDSQKQEIDSPLIDLFELTLPSGSVLYFHPGVEADLSTVHFRGGSDPAVVKEYVAFPMLLDGMEISSDGAINRPNFTVANIANAFSGSGGVLGSYKNTDLIGQRITRRQTLQKYLDNGSGSSTNPPSQYSKVTYLIDRVTQETNISVTFEVSVVYDLEGITLPRRVTIGKYCSWMYQGYEVYAKGGCTWHLDSGLSTGDTSGADSTTVVAHNVFLDMNDKPLVLASWLTSNASTWSSGGSYTTSSYVTEASKYWQSQFTHSNKQPGTPEGKDYWVEALPYEAHDPTEEDYNVGDLVKANATINGKTVTTIWYCILDHDATDAIIPAIPSAYWRREELCGKTLKSCKCRYQATMVSNTSAGSAPTSYKNTEQALPFGSFPGTDKF
ncbi:MAG: phage minor tail protein L [Gammaproteobacteria bacterium]|nr:phage minor tail protein L [Gammaproteobacteria bacterium]